MPVVNNISGLIKWLENRAIIEGEDQRYMQVEWQVAQQLRFIKDMLTDEQSHALQKFINRGVR